MGRVRTKTVKKASRLIIEKYYTKLTLDFHTNKRICEEIAIIPTKSLRNKIAGMYSAPVASIDVISSDTLKYPQIRGTVGTLGFNRWEKRRQAGYIHWGSAEKGFVTHLMKRLRHSQVRGISIKLQEEERERRDNYVPDVSALEQDVIEVDPETKDMLKMLEFNNIPGLQLTQPANQPYGRRQ